MDISSDLTELGKTPVAVISAGVKSILDISRTLEYLVLSFALFRDITILICRGFNFYVDLVAMAPDA
jgi:hypothetical protein